jgi:hypothetical protein
MRAGALRVPSQYAPHRKVRVEGCAASDVDGFQFEGAWGVNVRTGSRLR